MPPSTLIISVVIPAHNGARFLPAAIESIRGQVDVGDAVLEIIVVDDGSTDSTRDVVAAMPGVAYHYQQQAGAASARNAGVQRATGELLAFLDADDCWAPDKIARQRTHLATGVDMVFGHAVEFVADGPHASGIPVAPAAHVVPQASAPRIPARCAGTMLIARSAFLRVGDFSPTWRVGEFIDWYLRAVDLGLSADVLPDVVLYRRVHAENSGRHAGDGQADYLRIIKLARDRRRAR